MVKDKLNPKRESAITGGFSTRNTKIPGHNRYKVYQRKQTESNEIGGYHRTPTDTCVKTNIHSIESKTSKNNSDSSDKIYLLKKILQNIDVKAEEEKVVKYLYPYRVFKNLSYEQVIGEIAKSNEITVSDTEEIVNKYKKLRVLNLDKTTELDYSEGTSTDKVISIDKITLTFNIDPTNNRMLKKLLSKDQNSEDRKELLEDVIIEKTNLEHPNPTVNMEKSSMRSSIKTDTNLPLPKPKAIPPQIVKTKTLHAKQSLNAATNNYKRGYKAQFPTTFGKTHKQFLEEAPTIAPPQVVKDIAFDAIKKALGKEPWVLDHPEVLAQFEKLHIEANPTQSQPHSRKNEVPEQKKIETLELYGNTEYQNKIFQKAITPTDKVKIAMILAESDRTTIRRIKKYLGSIPRDMISIENKWLNYKISNTSNIPIIKQEILKLLSETEETRRNQPDCGELLSDYDKQHLRYKTQIKRLIEQNKALIEEVKQYELLSCRLTSISADIKTVTEYREQAHKLSKKFEVPINHSVLLQYNKLFEVLNSFQDKLARFNKDEINEFKKAMIKLEDNVSNLKKLEEDTHNFKPCKTKKISVYVHTRYRFIPDAFKTTLQEQEVILEEKCEKCGAKRTLD